MDSAASERFAPAALEALRAFPIDPDQLTSVWLGENVTFRVAARDGADYVLRLHRPGYHSLDALNAERLWTAALVRAGVGAPVGLRTRNGDWYAPVAIAETGEVRYAGLTTWTEGEVLADVLERGPPDAAPVRFAALGGIIASLHNQASAWRPPEGFKRHRLDRDGLMGEAPFWGRFWESPALTVGERSLASSTRLRLAGALDRLGEDEDTYGLIHADLHAGNVLVSGDRLAVIDFDDAGFGWHPYDIAVALFYQQREPGFEALKAALLTGYRSVRDLCAQTESLIPMFLLIRGLAVIGWLHQRPEIDPTRFMDTMKARILSACEAFEAPV